MVEERNAGDDPCFLTGEGSGSTAPRTAGGRLLSGAVSFLSPLAALVFPPACLACGAPLDSFSALLCDSCGGSVTPVRASDEAYLRSCEEIVRGGVLDGFVALYYFQTEGPLQALIHELKYRGMTRIGSVLGSQLAGRVSSWVPDLSPEVIVPVPLHPVKLRERGYDQSACIAAGMARALGAPVRAGVLRRVRYTQSQTHLDIGRRERNVAEAFRTGRGAGPALRGTTVLLVDDVVTTGATMRACARTLRASGIPRIIACAAALAVR